MWCEAVDEKARKKISMSVRAGELIRKWINIRYMVNPGSYFDDGLARAEDMNGFNKLDSINNNVQGRKNFIASKSPGQTTPTIKDTRVRSATGKAHRRITANEF